MLKEIIAAINQKRSELASKGRSTDIVVYVNVATYCQVIAEATEKCVFEIKNIPGGFKLFEIPFRCSNDIKDFYKIIESREI